MQQLAEGDARVKHSEVPLIRKRKASARRKVTVRLSEGICGRLDVATDRPGAGKSMLVEAALERFLNPTPSTETLMQARIEDMHARFDHLERDMSMIAETIALHARYHLTIIPAVPQSRQREAIALGDARFKVLAEQVDRRVRERRPLIQETIDRLNSVDADVFCPTTGQGPTDGSLPPYERSDISPREVEIEQAWPADVEKCGSSSEESQAKLVHIETASEAQPNPPFTDTPDAASTTVEPGAQDGKPLSGWRLTFSVFLPLAAGYYLAYLFRTINAAISPALIADFGLDAGKTGLLASIYFLVFGLTQIPIGLLLDRLGPRRVQGVLLVIASGGAAWFGNASSFPELLVARAMIGLGVAGSLMAGLKAIVTWFPRERVAFANGWMIMLGSLGALTATAPTDWLLNYMGWRSLFEILTVGTIAVAGLIYFCVPDFAAGSESAICTRKPLTLWSIYSDPRFLKVAPLSASCIGTAWAMQSLWASAWLTDVEGLSHQSLVAQMVVMAMSLSLAALLLGAMADCLRRLNIGTEMLLAGVGAFFIVVELALVLRISLPSFMIWSSVSIAGAATVLSFAAVAEYFPREFSARANGALNLLHFGWAFAIQYGVGLVVSQWTSHDGHYPIAAYQTAFCLCLILQTGALVWFALSRGAPIAEPSDASANPASSYGPPTEYFTPDACEEFEW